MAVIQCGRIEIAYEITGNGKKGSIILIRGQGTQLIHWPKSFYETFVEQDFKVLRFDNRDTGLSGKFDRIDDQQLGDFKKRIAGRENIDPPYTLEDMALDVINLMNSLNIDTVHIVGISMGGVIAQLMAANHPSRILSMTSIMSGSGGFDHNLIDVLWSMRLSRKAFIQEWIKYVREFGSRKYFENDAHSRRIAAEAYDRCYAPNGANRQLLALFSIKNLKDLARTISVPSLVVHGADDLLISPERGRETAELIPNAKFKLIDGMGHDIPPALGKPLAEIVLDHILSTAEVRS